MTYKQQVAAAAAALKKGEDANWELARLTYENTNRRGTTGGVTHARWAEDVRAASQRRFSQSTSQKYAQMWERFGDDTKVSSWTEAWLTLVPRDSGPAMRERATDTHLGKEATPERKREIFKKLVNDPEVLDDVHTEAAARQALRQRDEERVDHVNRNRSNDPAAKRLGRMAHELDAMDAAHKAKQQVVRLLAEVHDLDEAGELARVRKFILERVEAIEVALGWVRAFVEGERSWDDELAELLANEK